jgi:hypothetical protein
MSPGSGAGLTHLSAQYSLGVMPRWSFLAAAQGDVMSRGSSVEGGSGGTTILHAYGRGGDTRSTARDRPLFHLPAPNLAQPRSRTPRGNSSRSH